MFGRKEKMKEENKEDIHIPLFNTDFISGKTIETIGFVYGARFPFLGTVAGVEDIECAISEMTKKAINMGADAVINVRYVPSTNHAFVSGTAVKIRQ